jgi:hypothetical protein
MREPLQLSSVEVIAVAEGEPFLRAFVDRAALASDLLFHAVPPSIIGSTLIGIAALIAAACRVACDC